MPRRADRGASRLVWVVAAIPPVAVGLSLAIAPLRASLLGPALPLERPPQPTETRIPAVAPLDHATRTPMGQPGRGEVATDPASVGTTDDPLLPPEVGASDSVRLDLGPGAPAPPGRPVAPTSGGPGLVRLKGGAADKFIRDAYEGRLPPGVEKLHATLANGVIDLSADIDLDQVRQHLSRPVPDALSPLIQGNPSVSVVGKVVDSADSLVRFRLQKLTIGGVPVPNGVLEHFLRSELEGRGLRVEDPMVRSVRLPDGFDAMAIEKDELVLAPRSNPKAE